VAQQPGSSSGTGSGRRRRSPNFDAGAQAVEDFENGWTAATTHLKETSMAEADWTYLNDGLDIATVDRGVTAGIARPPGGGSFLFAFNSLAAVEGAVALFANLVNFAPMAKGGSIRGCVQRGPGGGPTGFSPFLFLCCQGNSVNDSAYLLGLSDDDPHRIVLRKGMVTAGIPDSEGPGALLASARASRRARGSTCASTSS
jgi:hypothetical protein